MRFKYLDHAGRNEFFLELQQQCPEEKDLKLGILDILQTKKDKINGKSNGLVGLGSWKNGTNSFHKAALWVDWFWSIVSPHSDPN